MAILHADSYARSLEERIRDGLRLFGLELPGKTILLKPNLVKYIPGAEVSTNPLVWSENWIFMKMRYFANAARRSR